MEGRRCHRRRPRRSAPCQATRHDTAFVHRRLEAARPLELHAHVSRVACCAVITDSATPLRTERGGGASSLCIASGDAVGNLSVFYFSYADVCTQTQSLEDEEETFAQRLRIRPDVRFRGAHRGSVNCMRHLDGTSLLLTGGDDGVVRLWDVRERHVADSKLQCVQEFLFHSSSVMACDMDPTQTFIATAGLDSVVAIWLRGIPIPLLTIAVSEPCFGVSIISTDPSLILVTHRECVTVWDIRTQPHYLHFQRALAAQLRKRITQSTRNHSNTEFDKLCRAFGHEVALSWTHDLHETKTYLTRVEATKPRKWQPCASEYDETTRRFFKPFEPHATSATLLQARTLHEGRTILTSASDHIHKLWNASTRQGIASFELPGRQSHLSNDDCAAGLLGSPSLLCHQHRFLYGADALGNIHMWELHGSVASLQHHKVDAIVYPIHTLRGHSFVVTSLALSRDDTILATGDASGKIHLRVAL